MMTPAGVWIASAAASAIEWFVLINSILKSPKWMLCPNLTTLRFTTSINSCSTSFPSMIPIVSFVAYTGAFISFNTKGSAPIWSSWPCVITKPLIFFLFSRKNSISGITQSIPSISSSGNDCPQSTTTILSLNSNAVIFIPICSKPPRGMILIFASLAIFLSTSYLVLSVHKSFMAYRAPKSASLLFDDLDIFHRLSKYFADVVNLRFVFYHLINSIFVFVTRYVF